MERATNARPSTLKRKVAIATLVTVLFLGVLYAIPTILSISIQRAQEEKVSVVPEPFPVTVDPRSKLIVESEEVNEYLEGTNSPLLASAGGAGNIFSIVLTWVATTISNVPWYQNVAAVNTRFVTIYPGMRKEQVAIAFADTLGWNKTEKQEFLTPVSQSRLPLPEGSFASGVYAVGPHATPLAVQTLVNERFTKDILSRYSTSTEAIVPLNQALIVASLIEREAGGADDMRIISGIIWNRLFLGMKLQIDATLQYAKASTPMTLSWWPGVVPADRFRKSAYNTYLHAGLPPTPIASPSVASVLAALNPKSTSCLFYFHDKNRGFHCTNTYAEHVALLKKYYGRGK